MHANGALLTRLYTALNRHDHDTMASCYRRRAHFRDIAFDLDGRERIHKMWRMICATDIEVEIGIVEADENKGRARIVARYRFDAEAKPPGRPVVNPIESRFLFEDGKILEQEDACDAKEWARQAIGGPGGFLAGHLRFLRSLTAKTKLARIE